jgi:RNA polymerase sigma-70 factor (ECF subfamily)
MNLSANSSTRKEDQLIGAAQAGDLRAFNQLVLDYQSVAYNVAYHILGNAEAAADATQDSFLKAYRAIRRYQSGTFRGWLMRIVTNTCYDQLRHRRRHPAGSLDALEAAADWSPWLTDTAERPHDYAERRELGQAIGRGMAALSEEQRTVMVLSDMEGFTYEEIAAATGMALGTVKSRLSRARAHLRDFLIMQPGLLPARYRQAA